MKKILIILSVFIVSFTFIFNVSAENSKPNPIKVTVTEKIPGADCDETAPWHTEEYPRYICNIEKWTSWVVQMFWYIIKWFWYLASLIWVLFIVYNGILYSMWWADQSLKDESKKRIVATLIWLVLLFLSWAILQLVAPWIYK